MKPKVALSILTASLLVSGNSFAFGLPDMPGGGSKKSNSSADATVMQTEVVHKYLAAAKYINTAQVHLAKAFDLKDQVAVLQAESQALQSGAVDDSTIKKYQTTSKSASQAIQKKIDAGAQLSEEGKKEYKASLLPYASGVMKSTKLPEALKSFSDAAKAQLENASPVQKPQVINKLSTGRYLVSHAPGFLSDMGSSFKQIVTYAKSNDIQVPDEATGTLGSL